MMSEKNGRRAKIVCTIGPAVASLTGIRNLVAAGMDVARLNFSHGTHPEHAQLYRWVRQAADEAGRSVGVLADLQGPKIRLGTFANGPVMLPTGKSIVITTEPTEGTADRVSTTYAGLAADVRPGNRLLVDDGNVALKVTSVTATSVTCLITEGGVVSDNKGISLPETDIRAATFSDKDAADLRFALTLGIDMVALSFVRDAEDATLPRQVVASMGRSAGILAKIETPQAVKKLTDISASFDGLMIARGDLGVELPLEQVPLVQKRGIKLSRKAGKPVIVATQMLESMVSRPRPTRAEVSDVANAVLDGADALMLSAETSVGRHPDSAVATMARIIEMTENADEVQIPPIDVSLETRSAALARAATEIAANIDASALAAFSETGATARRVARHRPDIPIVAFTPSEIVQHQLALSWGVQAFTVPKVATTDDMIRQVDSALRGLGHKRGELAVIVAGTPSGQSGTTNTIRVHRLGEL
jgi:pyruvate kinase